jgi:hypothetical protein
MRHSLLLSTNTLAGTLVLACGDQQSPTGPNDLSLAPAPGQIQSARAENFFFEFPGLPIFDPDRDITLIVGVPLSEVPECGGTGGTNEASGHVVITSSDIFHLIQRVRQGGLFLYGRFVENPCDLTAADLVASGQGNVTVHVWAGGSEQRIGVHVTGLVELVDGGFARILAVGNLVINTDTGAIRVIVDKFEVKPIGG